MKKTIIALSVLAVALVGCTSTPENPYAENTTRVLKADSKMLDNTKTVAEVVLKMESLNLTGCPDNVVKAYKNYLSAWKDLASIEKQMFAINQKKASSDIETFINSFNGNNGAATLALTKEWPTLANQLSDAIAKISAEFASLKSVALTAGVAYPQNGGIL